LKKSIGAMTTSSTGVRHLEASPNPPIRLRSRNRRGAAVLALVALIPVAAMTLALLQMGISFSRATVHKTDDERAFQLAEAGLAEAQFAMRAGGSGRVGSQAVPAYFSDGLFWTEITPVGTDLSLVRSVAMRGRGRAAVEQLVFAISDNPFGATVFSNKDLAIGTTNLIDSFDSSLGSYADQLAFAGGRSLDSNALVLSNGDVTLSSSVGVQGDIHPGPGGRVDIPSSSTASGSLESTPVVRELPPVTVPVIAPSGSLLVNTPYVLPAGDYDFDLIDVSQNGLLIRGPARIVVRDFTLRSNTWLVFDNTTGPIEIFVSGEMDWRSNSTLQTIDKNATGVRINLVGGPGQVATLNSNAEYYGVLYAPEGTIDIASNFEVFGAVVADELLLAANTKIHFDEALRALPATVRYVPGAWSLAPFPVAALRANRRDPFAVIGLDPLALPLPGAAHDVP
jgi:hypothetical protein